MLDQTVARPHPLWVRAVLKVIEKWDIGIDKVATALKLDPWYTVRNGLKDRHCSCDLCLKRRARGDQAKLNPWWKW